MANFRVTVSIVDAYGTGRPLLTQNIEADLDASPPLGDNATAIEVLKLVDGADCPYDCDTCAWDG